ncbi:MAG: DegT/DnrJ/EryC1/StrS family aminotransferase [Melioribacteraceae bacterium]|nr:DegT/DnrJ/EryC1/StrS family aminotransferase [Melioribacteraceae bacterium]
MKIPFVDLKAQYISIKEEINEAISSVLSESAFIKGRYVHEFEKEFAEKNNVNYCIGVANGTDAIFIVLKMLDIGPGDEVITTAHSWISTSETITQTGAKPVFIDIDKFYTIDVTKIEKKITSRTKAIIPVHLYGQPAEIDSIMELANKYNLYVIEDCAQAHFAEYKGQKVGTFGIAATFSFYPGKNLGAYGDAGAIISNDANFADKCRMYANHGALKKHFHVMEGINSRLDGLQAAILSVKLKYIDEWNQKRFEIALKYNELLEGISNIITPKIKNNVKHIFHVYCIQVKEGEKLKEYLLNKGIETQIHYPVILPFMQAYSYLNHNIDDFPHAFYLQGRLLSLPIYPELSIAEQRFVVEMIKNYFKGGIA